jgi:septal ring factor EnvC (AmiA/AmiB activator)
VKAAPLLLALSATATTAPELPPPAPATGQEASASTAAPTLHSASTAPQSDEERLRRVQERRAALEKELQELRGEEKSLLGDVEGIEVELRLRTEELQEIRISLHRTQAELDKTVERVQTLERSLAAARPALARHARALYKLGELSYVRLLLSVDKPSDFFRGYRFVTTLARRDNERVASFRRDLAALSQQKAELEKRTEESIALRGQLIAARRRLDAQRKKKTDLLTSIVEKKEIHAAYVEELSQAESRLEQLVSGLVEGEVAIPVAAFKGSLPWPLEGPVRAGFGRRKHPRFDTYTLHNGIEIASPPDVPVRAVYEGRVVFADRFRGYGLMVILDHGGKHLSIYAQLSELSVTKGQTVAAGDVVGFSGQGSLEEPGLYFEMRYQGHPEDPLDWLKHP